MFICSCCFDGAELALDNRDGVGFRYDVASTVVAMVRGDIPFRLYVGWVATSGGFGSCRVSSGSCC